MGHAATFATAPVARRDCAPLRPRHRPPAASPHELLGLRATRPGSSPRRPSPPGRCPSTSAPRVESLPKGVPRKYLVGLFGSTPAVPAVVHRRDTAVSSGWVAVGSTRRGTSEGFLGVPKKYPVMGVSSESTGVGTCGEPSEVPPAVHIRDTLQQCSTGNGPFRSRLRPRNGRDRYHECGPDAADGTSLGSRLGCAGGLGRGSRPALRSGRGGCDCATAASPPPALGGGAPGAGTGRSPAAERRGWEPGGWLATGGPSARSPATRQGAHHSRPAQLAGSWLVSTPQAGMGRGLRGRERPPQAWWFALP